MYLIQELLSEQPRYMGMTIPKDEREQKRLLRALFNIRMPKPVSEDFLKIQDAYLKEETKQKGITDLADLKPMEQGLYLWRGDITTIRCDDRFVQDEGWHTAADRYHGFIRRREHRHILFLELGVGYNTPAIIKYPFRQMTAKNPDAVYISINRGECFCPKEIENRSVCIDADIKSVLQSLI